MRLPTAREINPFQDLDGNCAEKHFLEKTLEAAEMLLREAPLAPSPEIYGYLCARFTALGQAFRNATTRPNNHNL